MSRRERWSWAIVFGTVLALVLLQVAMAQDGYSSPDDPDPADVRQIGGVSTGMIMWSALVGFFLPIAIEVPKQQKWSSWMKGLFAFACCMVAAAGTTYFSGVLDDFRDVATACLFVTYTALGSYKLLWKPSGIADTIGNATELGRTRSPDPGAQ